MNAEELAEDRARLVYQVYDLKIENAELKREVASLRKSYMEAMDKLLAGEMLDYKWVVDAYYRKMDQIREARIALR